MTEAEWLAGADPRAMLKWRRGAAHNRKLRLFACASARGALGRLNDSQAAHVRRWIEAGERLADDPAQYPAFADALAGDHDSPAIRQLARNAFLQADATATFALRAGTLPEGAASVASGRVGGTAEGDPRERPAQADLLRCIFGNPFRPVSASLDPTRLPPAVVALARSIYAARAFDRMPELADALAAAGVADPDVLAHCRGQGGAGPQGGHARGCWVVDAILSKA